MELQWECVQPKGKCLDRTIDCWWVSYDGVHVFRFDARSAQAAINRGEAGWVMPSPTPLSPRKVVERDTAIATAIEYLHELRAEWSWKEGEERAGNAMEYRGLCDFIDLMGHLQEAERTNG